MRQLSGDVLRSTNLALTNVPIHRVIIISGISQLLDCGQMMKTATRYDTLPTH